MIHKYKMFGTNIVLDVNSGSVHVVDEIAYDILDYYVNHERDAIPDKIGLKYDRQSVLEAIEEIEAMEKEGLLFSEDSYEEYVPLLLQKSNIKALCLHVSHDCNMRCRYCFASTGNFGGERTLMSPETGKKAIDFLIGASGKRRNLEVDFFGGEPLLNFDAVKEIVEYAKGKEYECGKNFRFTITTNALKLDENMKRYINEKMDNIVLSIDGRKDTNDRMRTGADGSGTYDRIMPRIKDMAESRKHENYYVRGTFTGENKDFSKDVLHLADEGFRQISVEPVVAAQGSGFEIREEDLDILFREYEVLAYECVERKKKGKGFNFFHFMIDLEQGPCIAKRLKGCGAGYEYLAVTPEGDLYPCHQFVGMEYFKMGTVTEGIVKPQTSDMFRNSNVYTKNECMKCWARFYCSGGCAANAYQFNRDIDIPYYIGCELEKKRIECAIWIKTQVWEEE